MLILLLGPPGQAPTAPKVVLENVPEAPARRQDLNLLGKTNTESGESRRNENVAITLLDNNALKESNKRLGTTATIVNEFRSDARYYGSEYGNAPVQQLHILAPNKSAAVHGSAYWAHNNSVFSARSFFSGGRRPARAR